MSVEEMLKNDISDSVNKIKSKLGIESLEGKLLKENQELKNQQKEFIDWLEKMINNLDNDINKINGISENSKREKERATIKYNILIQIIKKYKEMIGDK